MVRHVGESLALFMVLLGPLPLSFALSHTLRYARAARPPAERAVALLVWWCAIQTSLGIALGAAGQLRAVPVLTCEALLLALGLGLLRRRRERGADSLSFRMEDPQTLVLAALALLSLALAWWMSVEPIREGDSLAFRLPTIATWYQTGSFTMLDEYWFFARYPYGWELLCSLFVFPFREDFLVALPNLLVWALLGLSVYLLAMEMGAGELPSLTSAALVLTLPSIIANVDMMHNDLPLAAFFMSGLYLTVRYLRSRSPAYLALGLASLGLLAGVKTSGLVYSGLIAVPAAVWRVREGARPGAPSHRTPILLAGVLACVLTGGFWYARNLVQIGNPLGYVTVQIGRLTLLPGRLGPDHFRRTTIAALFEPGNLEHWRILAGRMYDEFSWPFILLALLALSAIPALIVKRKPVSNGALLRAVGLALVTGVLYAVTPYSGDNGSNEWTLTSSFVGQALRYAFPFCACLGVAAAAGATALRVPWGLLVGAVLVGIGARLSEVGGAMLYPLGGFVGLWVLIRIVPRRVPLLTVSRRASIPGIAAALLLLIPVSYAARGTRDAQRAEVYGPVPGFLRAQLAPDEPVGYLLSRRSYLLYGTDLCRRVVYVPGKPNDSRGLAECADLLRERRVTMLAVGPLGPNWRQSNVLHAMDAPGSPFTCLVRTDPATSPLLYKLAQ